MKYCKPCSTKKPLSDFHKDKTSSDGYTYRCKECKLKSNNENKEFHLQYHKEHYKLNKEIHLQRNKNNYFKDQDKNIQYHRKHYQDNKQKHAALCKRWREKKYPKKILTEDELRLKYDYIEQKSTLRLLVYKAITLKLKKSKANNILGCTVEECRQHLESQFKPEMTWENHGKVWEIDHIIGSKGFDLFKIENQKIWFNYTNLQPLFKTTKIAESFGYIGYIGNRNKNK